MLLALSSASLSRPFVRSHLPHPHNQRRRRKENLNSIHVVNSGDTDHTPPDFFPACEFYPSPSLGNTIPPQLCSTTPKNSVPGSSVPSQPWLSALIIRSISNLDHVIPRQHPSVCPCARSLRYPPDDLLQTANATLNVSSRFFESVKPPVAAPSCPNGPTSNLFSLKPELHRYRVSSIKPHHVVSSQPHVFGREERAVPW